MLTRAVRNTSLDEWAILLRETLQNSVDARLDDDQPITYRASLRAASASERSILRKEVFSEDIPLSKERVTPKLVSRVPLLMISDWHTRGLGGPTRADRVTSERADFRDFFLNVGRDQSKGYAGGTFGLGRGVLFDISKTGAIVVFTRTTTRKATVSRLMAMAIGSGFDQAGLKYTGRHWWGRSVAKDSRVEPLVGSEADDLAERLGMDVIPPGTTGTVILIVAPSIPPGVDLEGALDQMITASQLYGWPLMLRDGAGPRVEFLFDLNGEEWVPDPPDAFDSAVRDFVGAYRTAVEVAPRDGPSSWIREEITFGAGQAKPQPLGTLVLRHLPPVGAGLEEDPDAPPSAIPRSAVALMRKPRMVVRYLPVAPHPRGADTVGVFVADDRFDADFAESEPVAHDDWLPAKLGLERNMRNPVKQALDKVKRGVKESWRRNGSLSLGPNSADPLAAQLSDLLGGMLAGSPGFSGPSKPRRGSQTTPRPPRPTQGVRVGAPILQKHGRKVVAAFPVEVAESDQPVSLVAQPRVVTDSGVETEKGHPEGAALPEVFGWQDEHGKPLSDNDRVTLPAESRGVLLLLTQPADTAISVDVRLDGGSG